MSRQLNLAIFRPTAERAVLPVTIAQQGDSEELLLAKLTVILNKLADQQPRSGMLMDEAGVQRKVKRSGPKNIAASSTDSAVVDAVAGYAIRVISVYAVAGATATNLTFNTKPVGSGTDISGLLANAANGGEVLPRNPDGWFQTLVGEGLSVTTGTGATTGLQVNYILVPNYLTDENDQVLFDESGAPLVEA